MPRKGRVRRAVSLFGAFAALSCSLVLLACERDRRSVGNSDGAVDGGSPCRSGDVFRIATAGCGEDTQPVCTSQQVTCPAVACECPHGPNNTQNSFRQCDNPLVRFAHQGPCEADARCMGLEEGACKADAGCLATYGQSVDDYCSGLNRPVFAGCRRGIDANHGCGAGFTFARNPNTQQVLVFSNTCTPVGWAQIPGSCIQRP
jgi:hypothetical protein